MELPLLEALPTMVRAMALMGVAMARAMVPTQQPQAMGPGRSLAPSSRILTQEGGARSSPVVSGGAGHHKQNTDNKLEAPAADKLLMPKRAPLPAVA